MESNTTSTPTQWRWDRFDPKKVTSIEWASQNCVSVSGNNHELYRAMQKRVLQDERELLISLLASYTNYFMVLLKSQK